MLPPAELSSESYGSGAGKRGVFLALCYPCPKTRFALHKGDFRDALCLRYNWHPTHLPTKCACGQAFSVNHAMDCRTGGFPTRRQNEIRDITAEIMSEVCCNVMIEPQLQSLSGETFRRKTTKTEDNACLDISADAFWGTEKQRAFFDVRISNPNAQSYQNANLNAIYQRQEKEKRRLYEERVTEVEMGSFTPLVLSSHHKGNGQVNDHSLQKTRLATCNKAPTAIQPNNGLATLLPRILFTQIHHHCHQGG